MILLPDQYKVASHDDVHVIMKMLSFMVKDVGGNGRRPPPLKGEVLGVRIPHILRLIPLRD